MWEAGVPEIALLVRQKQRNVLERDDFKMIWQEKDRYPLLLYTLGAGLPPVCTSIWIRFLFGFSFDGTSRLRKDRWHNLDRGQFAIIGP